MPTKRQMSIPRINERRNKRKYSLNPLDHWLLGGDQSIDFDLIKDLLYRRDKKSDSISETENPLLKSLDKEYDKKLAKGTSGKTETEFVGDYLAGGQKGWDDKYVEPGHAMYTPRIETKSSKEYLDKKPNDIEEFDPEMNALDLISQEINPEARIKEIREEEARKRLIRTLDDEYDKKLWRRSPWADEDPTGDHKNLLMAEDISNYEGWHELEKNKRAKEFLAEQGIDTRDEQRFGTSPIAKPKEDIAGENELDRLAKSLKNKKDISSDNDSMIAQIGLLSSPESKSDGGFAKSFSPGKDGKLSPTQKFTAGLIKDFFTPKEEPQQQIQATSRVIPGRSFDISPLLAETKRPKRERYRNKGLLT